MKTKAAQKQVITGKDFAEITLAVIDNKLPPAFSAAFGLGCILGGCSADRELTASELRAARCIAKMGTLRRKYAPKILPLAEKRMQIAMLNIVAQLPPPKE